jgi:PhnB protein
MTGNARAEAGSHISLMLPVNDAPAAARWYADALRAAELWNLGSVIGLTVAGTPFFLGEPAGNGWETPATAGTRTARVELFTADPDAAIARAVAAGADGRVDQIRDHQMPWGIHRQGGFLDPFGHLWLVGDHSPLTGHGAEGHGTAGPRSLPEGDGERISLMLAVPDATAAGRWYAEALGADQLWDLGGVMGLTVAGAPFLLGEPEGNGWSTPADTATTTVRVELFTAEPDAAIARAVAAGADGSADPPRDHEMPWGIHRQGSFVDPFGHLWLVGDESPLRPH